MRLADAKLAVHLLLEHALRIRHHFRRECVRALGAHALRFIDDRELVTLDLGHQRDLVALHRDLVRVHLLFALRGEIAARAHRKGVGDETSDAGDGHRVVRLRCRRADYPRHQTEVRGQSIVEAVHHIA